MIFNHNVPAETLPTPAERLDNLRKVAAQMERECSELSYRYGLTEDCLKALRQIKDLKATLEDAHAKREALEQAETDRILKASARWTDHA